MISPNEESARTAVAAEVGGAVGVVAVVVARVVNPCGGVYFLLYKISFDSEFYRRNMFQRLSVLSERVTL